MKKIFLFALAALALGFTGCVEDEPYSGIISVEQTPGAVTPDDAVTITAATTNMNALTLKYTAGSAAEQSVTMTKSGNTFSGVIPAQADGTTVKYYVTGEGQKSVVKEYTSSAKVIDYSKLVLNEINGNDGTGSTLGKSVELFNSGAEAIPLDGVKLIKNDTGEWWSGTSATTIAAGGYLVISQNGTEPLKGASGVSPKQNLRFELKDPSGNVLSSFLRGDPAALGGGISDTGGANKDQTYQRCPNGTGDWMLATVTEGKANPATGTTIPQQ